MAINEIEQHLRDALAHLYDPNFGPSLELCAFLKCNVLDGMLAVELIIREAVNDLLPKDPTPSPQVSRFYEILHYRYLQHLTLEETSLRMNLSVSSTWREQRAAINYLTKILWKKTQAHQRSEGNGYRLTSKVRPTSENAKQVDWHEQAKRELAALYKYEPDAVADVSKVVESVLELEQNLAQNQGIQFEVISSKSKVIAAVHPTVLRQILIAAVGYFVRNTTNKKVTLFIKLEDGNIMITVTARFAADTKLSENELDQNIPFPDEVSKEVQREGNQVFLWLKFPSVDRVTVMVIDDNQDIVRLYRRASEGTNYRIVSFEDGQNFFDTIQSAAPDIIVLDVMLPGQDGWDLLMQLHANQITHYIPVIICSVVKEEELASALGAAKFLSKPVLPQDFIQALDQVLAQVP